ncbi:MAG: ATP-binding protein [Planctomycetota bacterium]
MTEPRDIEKLRRWQIQHSRYSAAKRAAYRDWRKRRNLENNVGIRKEGSILVRAPSELSLIDSAAATFEFIGRILSHVHRGHKIYIDLSEVTSVRQGAVMALIAALQNAKDNGRRPSIRGNWPKSDQCTSFLVQSGFLEYLYSVPRQHSSDSLFFPISSGHDSGNDIARALTDFYIRHAVAGEVSLTRHRLYGALIECMTNTKNHAFTNVEGKRCRWWVTAHFDKPAGRIRFTFFDNGLGIPTTVRQRLMEALLRELGPTEALIDCKLLTSAMNGEERTSTKKANRGKGLESIHRSFTEGYIDSLVVLSNSAHFDARKTDSEPLSGPLTGTLFTWSVPTIPADVSVVA